VIVCVGGGSVRDSVSVWCVCGCVGVGACESVSVRESVSASVSVARGCWCVGVWVCGCEGVWVHACVCASQKEVESACARTSQGESVYAC